MVVYTRDMSCSIEVRASAFSLQRLAAWLDQGAAPEFADQRKPRNAGIDTYPARWHMPRISRNAEVIVPKDHDPAEAVKQNVFSGMPGGVMRKNDSLSLTSEVPPP